MQCDDGMCGDVMMNEQAKTFDIDDTSPRDVENRRNDVDYVCKLILLQFAKISMILLQFAKISNDGDQVCRHP